MNPYLIAAAATAAFLAGFTVNGWRLGEQIQQERTEREQTQRTDADARALELWAADQRAQQEITEHEKRLATFERCIAAGAGCGLRVKVRTVAGVCPGEAASVGAGVEQTAELDPAARPDYRAVRSGIQRLEAALRVCVSANK